MEVDASVDRRSNDAYQVDRFTSADCLPEYLTVEEFYKYLRISRSLAYDLIRRQEIPHRRFGRRSPNTEYALAATRGWAGRRGGHG